MQNTKPNFLKAFFQLESSGGILLMLATVLALVCANTALVSFYNLFLDTPVEIRIGALKIDKPLLLWINDGLMAVFFFVVGLELKREVLEGELKNPRNIVLPGIGAIGGMAVPALFYLYFNHTDPVTTHGWAIPAATDIAFALGILSLLGSRVPTSIKIFLTSLAIFDDIGAIIIIALFYTSKISVTALIFVACCLPILFILNRNNVTTKSIYITIGLIMWASLLKSGVHATLTGVILAMFVPMKDKENPDVSPLRELEHDLHSVVAYFILPVFAFANAGISLTGIGMDQVFHDVPVGIALGLFLGKQVGVFGFCWLFIKLKFASLPNGMSWSSLYGTSALCGIGFTMSLFIASLAFGELETTSFSDRLGILVGSALSGILGYLILSKSLPPERKKATEEAQTSH